MCVYERDGVCMDGEGEGVYMEWVKRVALGEGEGGCVYTEGMECAWKVRGMCVYGMGEACDDWERISVYGWGEVACIGRGRGRMEGVYCVLTGR